MKPCSKCGEHKPVEAFNKRRGECRPCQSGYRRDYGTANRERLNGAATEYRETNASELASKQRRRYANMPADERRRINREYALRHQYGISAERYDLMLDAQGGGCAICGTAPRRRPLCVDHDHETGRIRGLLCTPCNTALGALGDNLQGVLKAVEYLR